MEKFDVEKLKLKESVAPANSTRPVKYGERFLKGPIPLPWLSRAAGLPGKALHVGLAVWYLRWLTKSLTVRLTNKPLREFGVRRQASYRGLKALEREGLVICSRGPGRAPVVTIITPSPGGTE